MIIWKSLQVWSAFSGILDDQIFHVATNKDDRVIMSNVKFQVPKTPISTPFIKKDKTFGSQPEKTCIRGLRRGKVQINLLSYRSCTIPSSKCIYFTFHDKEADQTKQIQLII